MFTTDELRQILEHGSRNGTLSDAYNMLCQHRSLTARRNFAFIRPAINIGALVLSGYMGYTSVRSTLILACGTIACETISYTVPTIYTKGFFGIPIACQAAFLLLSYTTLSGSMPPQSLAVFMGSMVVVPIITYGIEYRKYVLPIPSVQQGDETGVSS